MRCEPPRIIYAAHDSPGRVRFRLTWLRDHRHEGTAIAEALSELAGVYEVQVRPFTGSVLITYDPERADVAAIRAALCATTGVGEVTLPGHETPEQIRQILRDSVEEGSYLSQVATKAFQGLHVDVLRMTGGHASLGALTSLGMTLAGVARLFASDRLELPQWHELLWWGFRSFHVLEGEAIQTARKHISRKLHPEREPTTPDPHARHK